MMNTQFNRFQGGVTLVELMVALVMSIFLVGGILAMHLSGRASFLDNSQISRIQENVRFTSDYMIRDVRTAGFHDETVLPVGHEFEIRRNYAQVLLDEEDAPRILRVRYAGTGHCSETFEDMQFRLVENEYTIDDGGNLTCRGRAIEPDYVGVVADALADPDFGWVGPVPLVGGLTDINFAMICPPDGHVEGCVCDSDISTLANLPNACIGARITMEFEGLINHDAEDEESQFDKRSIELTAAFRNVILAQKNEIAFADADEE